VRRALAAAGHDPADFAATLQVGVQRQLCPQGNAPGEVDRGVDPEQERRALVGLLLRAHGRAQPQVAQLARRVAPIGKERAVQGRNERGHALDVPAPDLEDMAPLGRQVHRPPDLAKRRLADAAVKEVETLGVDDETLWPAQRQRLLDQVDERGQRTDRACWCAHRRGSFAC